MNAAIGKQFPRKFEIKHKVPDLVSAPGFFIRRMVVPEAEQVSRPWIRADRFGEMGLAPQPVQEYIRRALMLVFVVPIKIIGAVLCLVSFYLWTKVGAVLFPAKHRSDMVAWLGKIHWVRWVAVGWDGEPIASTAGRAGEPAQTHAGIVSNHLSWADILVHMSHFFPAFVARSSTASTMFVGSISKAMGCLYVERAKTKTDDQQREKSKAGGVRGSGHCCSSPRGRRQMGSFCSRSSRAHSWQASRSNR